MRTPRPVVLVAAACAVLALAGVAVALAASAPRLAGTNDLRLFHGISVPAGATVCQGPELVPADSARVRLLVGGTEGSGAAVALSVRDGGRTVARGGVPGGYGDGALVVGIGDVPNAMLADRVCIENRGRAPLSIQGETFPPEQAARIDGSRGDGRVRLEWLRAGNESWLELAPAVLDRFGLGKAGWLGSWTLFLAAALVLLSWVAALRLVTDEPGR